MSLFYKKGINMKTLLVLFAFIFTVNAQAAVKRYFQDAKFPNQVMIQKQSFGAPVAASIGRVASNVAGNTSASPATLSSFLLQPDVPRNITITPGGVTGDVESCVIVVSGTNYYGEAITEDFAFSADASSATVGNKAFKMVGSVGFPANCESGGFGATWSIGVGEKIGLSKCMSAAGDWLSSSVAGAYESTRATMAVDATHVESNTADFNGTMNGSDSFTGYYFQNFRCHP